MQHLGVILALRSILRALAEREVHTASMLSLAALVCLILAGMAGSVSPWLAVIPGAAGLLLATAAINRPGDMEWLLGLFLLGAIGWTLVQFGSLFGLWSL